MGREPLESDLVTGLLFMALCNIVLYGVIVYCGLLILSLIRKKPVDAGPPPPPSVFSVTD